jgi:uncharacterized protein (DUF433 family)
MQLEDYFEFEKVETVLGPAEEIWIKGSRIILDFVIEEYKKGTSPERIVSEVYPSLTLDKVYATILYYLVNKEAVEAHIELGKRICEANYQDWLKKEPAPVVKRLRELQAQQGAAEKGAHG